MSSKRVGCSPFLPTTESDSYRERESVRESKLQSVRERERPRATDTERESKLQRESARQKASESDRHRERA